MLPSLASPRLHLEIDVKGHEEIDGCTYYELHCAFTCKLVEGNTSGRSAWISNRRLAELRVDLYSPLKAALTEESYGMYFGGTPFARRGGVPGTTARLDSWCRALAKVVNTGKLPPEVVKNILRALGSPVEDPFVALGRASFSSMDSDASDLPQAMSCLYSDDANIECKVQEKLEITPQTSEASLPSLDNKAEEHEVDEQPILCSKFFSVDDLAPEVQPKEQMVAEEKEEREEHEGEEALGDGEHDFMDFHSVTSSPRAASSPEHSPSAMSSSSATDPIVPSFGPFESFPYGEPAISGLPSFWTQGFVETFRVREVGYLQSREKSPSGFAIYTAVAADAIRSDERIDEIVSKLPLDSKSFPSPSGALQWSPTWGVPRVLIVNAQLPYKPGSLLGSHPADDAGFSLVSYHVLSAEATELLARDELSPALQIWRRLVNTGASSKDGTTFKAIGHVANLPELSVPRIVHQFNAKPVAVTKSATILKRHLPEILEISFDVRQWAYLARKSLVSLGALAKSAVVDVGYVVEGKNDSELPEQILAHFTMHYADIERVQNVSNDLHRKQDAPEQYFVPPPRKIEYSGE